MMKYIYIIIIGIIVAFLVFSIGVCCAKAQD
jgi:hypothetical protein